MKKIKVIPLENVDGVPFGTAREEVRRRFGEYDEFRKTGSASETTDDFGYCHVYYADGKMEAVEIFDAEVYMNETKIFPISEEEARAVFTDLDDELISTSMSVGIYAPDGEAECILLGCRGYYDSEADESGAE